ncbi:Thioredoxin domain-containing protein 12 [Habropoda laboriosa]|uniref:Thioredoxin domain-containing protein 12 n=1 Tax=Habropoda laboriosa TaxID=597456 RepID=A0A0L7QX95_9HYME|nr:Thioredoxin domain-containing protein 12 [Habropoda laboriosa]
MIKSIKYLSALNLINLANHLIGNNLTLIRNSNCESDFEQLFKWRPLKDGFEEAKIIQKPIFLLIHKPQCPSCQKLKKTFAKSVRLMDLSDRFVMIKTEMGSDVILDGPKFQPDDKYVPKILFFTSKGDFIKEAYNKHTDADKEHKYFYKSPSQIVDTMLYVLKEYSKEPLSVMFEHERPSKVDNHVVEDDIIAPTLLHWY